MNTPRPRIRGARFLVNSFTRVLLDPIWALHTLGECDALVITGTGIAEDSGGIRAWQAPWTLFVHAVAARVRRRSLAFVDIGVSGARSRAKRFLFGAALKLATYRSYRDEGSKVCALNLGVHAHGDSVYPDLCFALPGSPATDREPGGRSGEGLIGVGVMNYSGDEVDHRSRQRRQERYVTEMTELVAGLIGDGFAVRLLIGERSDVQVAHRVKEAVELRTSLEPGRLQVDEPEDLGELMARLAPLDAAVVTRFHNIVAAVRVGTPVVAICYAAKSRELMQAAGQRDFCADVADLNHDELRALLDEVLRQGSRIRGELARVANHYSGRVNRQVIEVVQALAPHMTRRTSQDSKGVGR